MSKILVAGVAVLDFIFHMENFPRTPEKFRASGASISGGGNAANAAVVISRLGGQPHLAARLGDDEIADLILCGLEREKVNTDLTRRFIGHRSSFSSVYIDGAGERQIMNYRDNTLSMDADWLEEWLNNNPLKNLTAALCDTRWPGGAFTMMQYAKTLGIPGIIDAEAPVMEAMEAVFAASHVAFSAQGVIDFTGKRDVGEAALSAQAQLSGKVFVTDGANGTISIHQEKPILYPAHPVTAVDTLGAGDAWHGAFALALGEGQSDPEAIAFANAAATLKCTRGGGREGAPSRPEVIQFLEEKT